MNTDIHEKKLIDMIYKEAGGRISAREAYASFIAYSAAKLNMGYQYKIEQTRNDMFDSQIDASKINNSALEEMFEVLLCALETNPDQDFLGEVFQKLYLTNARTGQYMTPYSASKMIAQMNIPIQNDKKVISIADPCCGAGAMLIAAVNVLKENNQDPKNYFFYAQDIDWLMSMTTYVQLALQGVQGLVVVGNSLDTNSIPPKIIDTKDSYVLPVTYVYNPTLLQKLKATNSKKIRNIDDRSL